MWLKSLIEKIFSLKISSEKEWAWYDRDDETVLALAPSHPLGEAEMQAFIDDSLDAWTQLYSDNNQLSPTDEQLDSQRIIIQFAFEEINSLEAAIEYLVDSIYENDESDDPETGAPQEIINIAKAAIAEYINGNLRLVQNEITKQD